MKGKTVVREYKSNYDILLVMLVLLLSVFGLVMIYSTSSYNAAKYYDNARLYFNRQGIFLMAGFFMMIVVSMIDYRIYIRPFRGRKKLNLVWLLYLVCLALQGYTFLSGYEAGGSARWISLPGIGNFQPSEIIKICFIVFVAYWVQSIPTRMNKVTGFLSALVVMSPFLLMVALQNLSTAVILAVIMGGICFVGSRRRFYYIPVIVGMAGLAAVALFGTEYRRERFFIWLNNENVDPGSQITQGLYAIASGGLWGKGLGQSSQKLGYIPEVHTDMIFTIICEELGIFGAILVIAVFLMLLWRLLHIAVNAPDLYGGLIATGVMVHIATQFLINIAVVTRTIPATGIPLPFISYGGSSLMVLMMEMGLALSVSKYTNKDKATDE